jgi:hypothetical protein
MLQALLPTMEVVVKVKKMKENISIFRYVTVCSPCVKVLVLDQNSKYSWAEACLLVFKS